VGEATVAVLKEACRRGDMTRAGVLKAAESLGRVESGLILPGVEVTIGPYDHKAIEQLAIISVKEGRWERQLPGR